MEKSRFIIQLNELIQSLQKSEISLARKHILAYESNHTANNRRMFQLFKLIAYKGIIDFDYLKKKISPDSNIESFNRLIRRTINRIYESLLLDVNIKRKDAYNEVFRVQIEVRKQLIRAQILLSKGLINQAKKTLVQVIRKTREYELFDELIEGLFQIQRILSNRKNTKEFDQYSKQIEHYELCRKLLLNTMSLYQNIKIQLSNSVGGVKNAPDVEEKINLIRSYYEDSKSVKILSYYYLLIMEFHFLQQNFKEEINVGLSFIRELKSNRAIYSMRRISYLYSSISNTLIGACDFENTLKFASASVEWSKKNPTVNYLIALEQKAKALFYLGDYEASLSTLNQLNNTSLIKKYPLQATKIKYYKALNLFLLGEYKMANRSIYNLNEIEKDKEGWNIWIRLLRILIALERKEMTTVDFDLESYRKYLERIDVDKQSRIKVILRVINQLERNDLDYKSVSEKCKKDLGLLESLDSRYKWNSTSPEMIVFHEWFKAKEADIAYNPDFSNYHLRLLDKEYDVEKV